MKTKLFKNMLSLILLTLMVMPVFAFALTAQAEEGDDPFGVDRYASRLDLPGEEETDVRDVIVSIIKVVMTFLGIIAVVVILIGGFKWMTAGGNEEKVAEARRLIIAGVVGLIIIIGAWVITNWVINTMMTTIEPGAGGPDIPLP